MEQSTISALSRTQMVLFLSLAGCTTTNCWSVHSLCNSIIKKMLVIGTLIIIDGSPIVVLHTIYTDQA